MLGIHFIFHVFFINSLFWFYAVSYSYFHIYKITGCIQFSSCTNLCVSCIVGKFPIYYVVVNEVTSLPVIPNTLVNLFFIKEKVFIVLVYLEVHVYQNCPLTFSICSHNYSNIIHWLTIDSSHQDLIVFIYS